MKDEQSIRKEAENDVDPRVDLAVNPYLHFYNPDRGFVNLLPDICMVKSLLYGSTDITIIKTQT